MTLERIAVVYAEELVGDPWRASAIGPMKPGAVAAALRASDLPLHWIAPEPASREDLYRTHDPTFVDDVLDGRRPNAFGTHSRDLARSLPYTSGAVYSAALAALDRGVSASLTGGFHHAHFDRARSFCTFNGLVVACMRLLHEARVERVLILDGDYHRGDGTDALIAHHRLGDRVRNLSLGERFRHADQANDYLRLLRHLDAELQGFRPDLVLYQAGADVHLDDPLGGMLTTEQMTERDRVVFRYARERAVPIAWNLAGGYQVEEDGSFPKVVALHVGTFRAACEVFVGNVGEAAVRVPPVDAR